MSIIKIDERITAAKRVFAVDLEPIDEQTIKARVYVKTPRDENAWVPVGTPLSAADASALLQAMCKREKSIHLQLSFSAWKGEGTQRQPWPEALERDFMAAWPWQPTWV